AQTLVWANALEQRTWPFDPPLGSTSPAVLLDNATRLDKLVNGPAGPVNGRAGQPLDTWRQIVTVMLAAVTDAQNSIPLLGSPLIRSLMLRLQ
ncbi:hypothetical protein V6S18_25690, partial [Klebsiella pneumoniae]